jgi:type I restriction enzyme S subunit
MATKQTVGDYASLQRGTTYKGNLVGKPGPALLGLGSIRPGGGFRDGDYKTYGGECPPKLMLYPGDLFVSLKGATKDGEMIGSIARVPSSVSSGRLTQDTVKLVFHERNQENENYIYWLLRTPQYRAYCAGRATGSAVVALSRDDFLSFPVPPLTPEKLSAVKLLEAGEKLIELNRKTTETLEEMMRALFQSWFVDFDPIHAKFNGRDPGLPPSIADLLSSSFEDSRLGPIPKGWSISGLDELGTFLNGLALQKYPAGEDGSLPAIKIAQLRAGSTENADRVSKDIPSNYRIDDGDVLFSWSGSLECVVWTASPGALNQHLFKVTSERYPKWFYLGWILHHLPEFKRIAAAKATTMGHIQRHHLREALVVIPPADLLNAIEAIFGPLLQTSIAVRLRSKTLSKIRDTLLPKLISGELRISDSTKRLL